MTSFEARAHQAFELETLEHVRHFAPRVCAGLGDEGVQRATHESIVRARSHGLTLRGPIRLYVELCLLRGIAFDTDPVYPAARRVLAAPADEMIRAMSLHEEFMDSMLAMPGSQAGAALGALGRLAAVAPQLPAQRPLAPLERALAAQLAEAFPAKSAFAGRAAVEALARQAIQTAEAHGGSQARDGSIVAALMMAFGHGCVDDPWLPWIGRTLRGEGGTDVAQRSQRLEQMARAWLEHLLAETPQPNERRPA